MFLKFDIAQVVAQIKHAQASEKHALPYDNSIDPGPGLWLVGDRGVYLMSNGNKEGRPEVVFAEGINPNVDDFETWWFNKNEMFGGDDGADSVPQDWIGEILKRHKEGFKHLLVKITPNKIGPMRAEM